MIAGFRHFGISVFDLEKELSFYCDGLSFELSSRLERPMDYIEKVTGVEDTAVKAALITKDGIIVELLEYRDRTDRPVKALPNHYPGAAHICLQVKSIKVAIESLIPYGASFQKEITTVPSGAGEGNKVIYGWDPEGIAFELVEIKQGEVK